MELVVDHQCSKKPQERVPHLYGERFSAAVEPESAGARDGDYCGE